MGAGAHPLYRHGDSAVHRAPAEVKIVALLLFVLAVVATPRETFWPFAAYAVIIVAVWRLARIPLRWVLPRMLIEAPFLVLAVLLPFAEGGQRVTVAGLQLSVAGLWAAWGIVIKGTLGVAAALTVAATTSAAELPAALSRLGVPGVMTSVLVLMIRYIDLLTAEAGRMRMARIARGDSPRALHQARAIAAGIGALFLRSYERGERVYAAMLSRGFEGSAPDLAVVGAPPKATARQWAAALTPAVAAAAVSVAAWTTVGLIGG
ncbi:cobalt ABC transporter, permease protein CbiQ [Mycolicibacterium hassiacum DSM 44199]|jgi:cobalt/nickel transport system permease protein|uniref:Cobalt ABC transporter, permease protein CbiQ n=1 Tax=Mycolicibacterium hassiacum (strain DSM 44199 / CIP 105218 / JCM 12690 / 3849) TaxID=1122247 RepID=K5BFU3_MYCHD|nr:cobalt ECF transporter T component CbiQ [Mycolicibacterium hassiacum]EKF24197.1 cobalt ABC transporter, permease protein CbiQ [Mycolicibacterium hassiacum DSM 44199]MBX5486028.1 cobalt ECF transporter T component CbiQ [Mycolicibacterium hassiacum]MDA4087689.1 cobalt ABC transporter permease [Mycolicibacterium hassiacum DSM 44199]VCT90732.1 Energy-coupling factor transporter transmembrane protein EcfT [Mycolicibacterium hassiacum DSM 44199]